MLVSCSSVTTTAVHHAEGGDMAYSVSGVGHPTVVLQSGLGDGKNPWSAVMAKLTSSHRVFAYDRPGYGESAATSEARDACTIATELRGLLKAARVDPPYLLVGHSIGGLYQYAFAKLYPSEVAGLVLLDPTHPKHWQRMQSDVPTMAALISGMRATVFSSAMRREFDDQEKYLERLNSLPPISRPTRVHTRMRFELAELGPFESMVRSLEPEWKVLVGVDRVERVAGSGHYIQREQPAQVVAAIEAVAAQSPTASK